MDKYIELLVTLGFLGGLIWAMMKFMLRDLHKDMIALKTDMNEIKIEMKELRSEMHSGFQKSDARIDHLYEENNRLYKILLEMVKK